MKLSTKNFVSKCILLLVFLLAIFIVSCSLTVEKAEEPIGDFELRDGVETYIKEGQVIRNQLIEHEGKLYYVDGEGHKSKDTWGIVDNDGHYGYFGSLGDLVIDKIRHIDGKDYYFDENGVLYQDRTESNIKVIDGVEYIANKNGELILVADKEKMDKQKETQQSITQTNKVVSQQTIVSQQVVVPQQQIVPNTTSIQSQTIEYSTAAPFVSAINETNGTTALDEFGGPGIGINTAPTSNTTNVTPTSAQSSSEVKIVKTEKIIDYLEGDDYDCSITLLKPIMNGSNADETENINSCIEDIMDAWLDDVKGVIGEYDTFPKSVTFNSATLGSVNNSRMIINLSGSVKPKSGSSKTIKYRITYDRKEANAEITQTK